jgi:hypothetical protein
MDAIGESNNLVVVSELQVKHSTFLTAGWDEFAHRCDGSFLCSQGYVLAMRWRGNRLRIFEFFAGDRKVGQCAVAQRLGRAREFIFMDSILLLPGEEFRWTTAMEAVLRAIGPGRYRYGSESNTAASRRAHFEEIHGVTVLSTKDIEVHAVDFSTWPDWDSYKRAMSTNAKRNAAKAVKSDPGLRIERFRGLRLIRCAFQLVMMRRRTYRRKGAELRIGDALEFLRRMALLRRYVVVDRVDFRGRHTAYAFGLRFGGQYFYIHGACVPDNGGSAWYLLTELLRETKSTCPNGKFLMGCDTQKKQTKGWDNVLLQRQQCKVAGFPTSIVNFRYGM